MDKPLSIVLRAVGATQTARDVAKVDSSVAGLTKRAGTFATTLRTNVSGAMGTFGGRIKQLIGVGAGFLGVGGLLGLGAVLKDSISKAQAWGEASLRLAQITKLPIEMTSKLIDALDYFGVSAEQQLSIAAKYEKALGGIAKTSKSAAAFEKEFGLKIRDAKGHLLDYNQQLLVSADYFNNKSIPASTKALALSKLYGKSWTDLIPILAQGRVGILKAEQDAMHMSQADLDAITKNKEATRKWTDALGDLETQIGIKLLPTLTEMLTGITGFVDSHTDEIIEFVQKAVAVGKTAVGTIVGVAEELGGLWDAIPAPLRDFLIKFTLGERAIKFLFGISPLEVAVKFAEKAGGGIVEGLVGGLAKAGVGKAFVQPVFVTNPGFSGGGGLPGGAAAAGEGVAGAAAAEGAGVGLGMTVSAAITAVGAGLGLAAIMALAAELIIKYGKDPTNIGGRSGTAGARGLPPSRIDPTFAGPRSAAPYGSYHPPAGALSVEDRTLREPLIAAASKLQDIKDASQTTKAQAKANAANAAADIKSLQAALSARLEMTNSRLEAIKDKSQSVIVNLKNTATTVVRISASEVNRAQTTFKIYGSGSAGKFQF